MTKRSLRLCSVLLTLVMLINMFPLNAVADEETISLVPLSGETSISKGQIVEEVEENRTEFSKDFKLDNGLYISAVYAQPVHYQVDGAWEEIDNTLRTHLDGTYSNTAGLWDVRFPQQLSGSNAITVTKDGYTLSFAMAGELRAPGSLEIIDGLQTAALETEFESMSINGTDQAFTVQSAQTAQGQIQTVDLAQAREETEYDEFVVEKNISQLLYANVYGNTDIRYDLKSNQLKESIILEAYSSTLRGYRYILNVGDMIPVLQEDNSIYFYDANRENIVMVMPAPYLVDADDQYNHDIQVSLTGTGSSRTLIYLLPAGWLAEEDRSWPVVLDPVVTPQIDIMNIRDHTVASNGSYSMYRYVLECGYGPSSHIHRVFLKYQDLPALSATDIIVEAEVKMYKLDNTSNSSGTMEVHKVLADWETNSLTWNNKPGYDTTVADSVVIGNGSGYFSWDVTDIVRDWYTGQNYGMMFKMDDATEAAGGNSWKQFYASDHGVTEYMPSLTITYQSEDTLSAGYPVNVNIAVANEKKYFSFTPTKTGIYVFQSSNQTGDPKVWLYDSSYTLLDDDDDSAGNKNFRLEWSLIANETYYIAAGHYGANTGSYSLTVLKTVYLDNTFYRVSNYGTDMYLDIHGPDEQTYVQQRTSQTGEQQKWLIQWWKNGGYYTIRSQYGDNKYLGVTNANTGENNVQLFSSMSDNTRWNIYITATGRYIFEPKIALGKALYAPDSASGTEMRLAWMGTGGNNDKWYVNSYTYSGPTFSAFDIGNSEEDEVAIVEHYLNYFGYTDIGSYKNDDGFVPGQLVKDLGKYSDIVYINAHGGKFSNLYVQEYGSTTDEKEEYFCAAQTVNTGDSLPKISIGAQFKIGSTTETNSYWNAGTKWVIISSCDQLNYVGDRFGVHWNGLYSAQVWAQTMLGDGERIHGFLGYYDAAPPEDAHTISLDDFFNFAKSMTIIDAWKNAHPGGLLYANKNWAVMYHSANANDRITSFTDTTASGSKYTIYLERFEKGAPSSVLSSESNNISANSLALNANTYAVFAEADVNKINSIYSNLQGKLVGENSQLEIDEHNRIVYNNFTSHTGEADLGLALSDKQAVAVALQQLDALGIAPDGDYKASVSYVRRYQMDLNSEAVSEPETIAYNVCFYRTYNGIDMLSDQGDGIVVSFDKYGLTNLQYKWRDVQVVTDAEQMSASGVTSTQAKNMYLAAVEEDTPDTQLAANTGEIAEPVVTQAYLEIDNEMWPVWVCSPDGGYGNHIFIDMQTGEQITVA